MKEQNQLSETESLEVIQRMLMTAKNELVDDSFYFKLWGWLVFIASIGHYLLMNLNYDKPYLVWLLMPVGVIISFFYGKRQNENMKVKSYVDDLMKYVLIAFGISLTIVLSFQVKLGLNTYPMVMIVYAVLLFVSGGAIQFKPLIAGGIVNWVIGIASFFVTFDIQLLMLAFAVLFGFIIPGHMLKSKFKKSTQITAI